MSYYVPIFARIVDSSLWAEPDFVVKVFITMLAKKDRDNVCRGSAFNIARWSNKTEEEVLDALRILSSPDKRRLEPQAYDGRRIEKVEDGWLLLNGEVYQKMMKEANRKQYLTEKKREERGRKVMASPPPSDKPPVTPPVLPATPKPSAMPPVECVAIFAHLNELTGSKFRPEGAALTMLRARLAQPDVTPDEVLKMISRQCKLWGADEKMKEYLRPSTLFNATKFNEYYAAREQPIPNRNGGSGKPNPRNFGIVDNQKYGLPGQKTRLEREFEEKKRLAEQTSADADNPSADNAGAGNPL